MTRHVKIDHNGMTMWSGDGEQQHWTNNEGRSERTTTDYEAEAEADSSRDECMLYHKISSGSNLQLTSLR